MIKVRGGGVRPPALWPRVWVGGTAGMSFVDAAGREIGSGPRAWCLWCDELHAALPDPTRPAGGGAVLTPDDIPPGTVAVVLRMFPDSPGTRLTPVRPRPAG